VNASHEFRKGAPKNYLTDDAVRKVADAFLKTVSDDGFAGVITNEEAAKNDFNLSPSWYVSVGEETAHRDIKTLSDELKRYDKEAADIGVELSKILSKL